MPDPRRDGIFSVSVQSAWLATPGPSSFCPSLFLFVNPRSAFESAHVSGSRLKAQSSVQPKGPEGSPPGHRLCHYMPIAASC
jgi:hypothetical protein